MLILGTVWLLVITREPEERTLSSLESSDMANVFQVQLSYQRFQQIIHLLPPNISSTRRNPMIHPSRSFANKLLSERYTSIRKINFESSKLHLTSSLKSITQLQCTTSSMPTLQSVLLKLKLSADYGTIGWLTWRQI